MAQWPSQVAFDMVQLLSRRYDDPAIQDGLSQRPFVAAGVDGLAVIAVDLPGGRETLSLENVTAVLLTHLRRAAETHLGERVAAAVLTVPSNFGDAQRLALRRAAALAGIDVTRIVNAPVAVVHAYGLDRGRGGGERIVLVVHVGGHRLDVTALACEDGVIEALAEGGCDLPAHASCDCDSGIEAPASAAVPPCGAAGAPLLDLVDAAVRDVLASARLSPAAVGDIALVGNGLGVPGAAVCLAALRTLLTGLFGGRAPLDGDVVGVLPAEAVVFGAAVAGGVLSGAPGAAVSASSFISFEILELSLGVETASGRTATILCRNTMVPTSRRARTFTTSRDGQTAATVRVLQGEHALAGRCRVLGELVLRGLPAAAPRGAPRIDVEFEVDVSGVLIVSVGWAPLQFRSWNCTCSPPPSPHSLFSSSPSWGR